ncbi:MAG: zf-TFIIB domain-containing protein [Anaerolineae bacterium]|jgi:Zn-finger nucleic acid-binding protein
MLCPRCEEPLGTGLIDEVEIEQCSQCDGMWFDQGELRKAKDAVEPDLNWLDLEIWRREDEYEVRSSSIACPRCDAPLAAVAYGETGVVIDYCAHCEGTWLDGGEFERIITALAEEVAGKDVPDYVAASLEEAQELLAGEEGAISEWRDFLTVLRLLQYRILVEHPRLREIATALQKGTTSF